MMKYELRRAFSKDFVVALAIGVLSGIGGLVAYYSDSEWSAPAEISCFDAWLYCLSVSEGSFYRAVFPIIVCLPYLPTFYSDRRSHFIYNITTRTTYFHYFRIKVCVGILSAISVILLTLFSWLCLCIILFPCNLPITEFNYRPNGMFSQYFGFMPFKYIIIIILINLTTGAIFYLLSMVITSEVRNKQFVIIIPIAIYLFFVFLSQTDLFHSLNPVALIVPDEVPAVTFPQMVKCWLILMCISFVGLYSVFKADNKEIL